MQHRSREQLQQVQRERDESRRIAERNDAIHRALLTGLLGNVGLRTEPHEYTGARNTKFYIFPGSSLFQQKPPWVMAGELVETTRLYARTVAPVKPQWIERAAEHLVKREYAEPHWRRETANVVAYERVTLYGLPIVPRRLVHYGPIDPKVSRELFIQNALVEGEYNTDAPYFRHNRDLIRELELMEAKLRTRAILVDARTRYAFYDARIPQGVFNGFTFERWRREAEGQDKRVLFMTREDLMLRGAQVAEPGLYPDAMTVHGLRLRLDYRLDPGHPADGVTATVPLAALNGLPPEPFDWLVPGMLKEKVLALIKTLPKATRVHFVPAPESADVAAAGLTFGRGSLFEALANQLGKQSGVTVRPIDFKPEELPDHLRMNFRVVDESGKPVAVGRDLTAIKKSLGALARSVFEALPPTQWHKDHLTRWDFGDLPEKVEIKHNHRTLLGYPALVDNESSVSLRLFDSADAARQAHQAGVRRLFAVQLREEMKYLARRLPGIERMSLHYAPLGNSEDLQRDLLAAIADRALFGTDDGGVGHIRTQAEFIARAEPGWRRLSPVANEMTAAAGEILALFHEVSKQLERSFPPLLTDSVKDMRQQLAHLVPKDFLTRTPAAWLKHLTRFLKGIQIRLQKLQNAGLARDLQAMTDVTPHWQRYLSRREKHRKEGVIDPALEQYRWMIEELRVSLFAQELRTSVAVSPKRVDAQWALVQP